MLLSKFPKLAIQPNDSGHNEVDILYQVERVWNIVEYSKLLIPAMKERKQELTQNTKHSK